MPGDNTVPMTSNFNLTQALGLLQDGVLAIDIRGNKSVYNGQEIPYFSEALASNQLTTRLNISSIAGGLI